MCSSPPLCTNPSYSVIDINLIDLAITKSPKKSEQNPTTTKTVAKDNHGKVSKKEPSKVTMDCRSVKKDRWIDILYLSILYIYYTKVYISEYCYSTIRSLYIYICISVLIVIYLISYLYNMIVL
jgi:hypothetical protein